MVNKDLKVRHAVFALIITLAIFLMGGLLGYTLNVEKARLLTEETHAMQSEIQNMQLSLMYMDTLGPEHSCPVLLTEVTRATDKLNELGKKLQSYQDAEDFGTEFFMLKDEYSFLELRTWLYYHKLREECGTDTVDIVYFYSSVSCDGCIGQGKVIDNVKRDMGDRMLVFSFDTEWEQPILTAFMQDFGVDVPPAVIINGQKFGYLDEPEFRELLCNEYTNKPESC